MAKIKVKPKLKKYPGGGKINKLSDFAPTFHNSNEVIQQNIENRNKYEQTDAYTKQLALKAVQGAEEANRKKYIPSQAVKNTKALNALAQLAQPYNPYFKAIGTGGDIETAIKYGVDGQYDKMRDDLIQAGIQWIPFMKGSPAMKQGTYNLSTLENLFNFGVNVTQKANDTRTITEVFENGGNITTENNMKTKIKKGKRLPKAELGIGADPFMQNAIANKINYWNEKNANGDLPQQINLGNVGGKYTVPPAQDYGDIDESQFGQQNPNYLENPMLTQEIVKEPDYKNSLKLKNQIEDYRNPAPKINFKKPNLSMFPTMGNKYLNRGMQYLNQSISHANAIGTDPNSWEQPLNYQNGISNNPFLSTDVNKKYTTLRPKQDTYTLETENVQLPETQQSLTPKLTKFGDGGKNKDKQYLEWKEKLPKNLQYEGNYDLRGFYNENPNFNPSNSNQHLTDKFKLPNHPTFSNESKYFNMVQPQILNQAGYWYKTDSSYNYIPYNPMYKDTVIEKFGDGGRQPIIVNDKNDPRLKNYNDSLNLYNSFFKGQDYLDSSKEIDFTDRSKLDLINPPHPTIKPIETIYYQPKDFTDLYKYKKPIQPVIYQESRPKEPTFELNQEQQYLPQKEQHLEFDPIGLKKGTYFTRPRQQQEAGQGKMDYFDSKTGKLIKTMGDGGMNQNQFNNLQALGTGVNATQSGINFGKGITDIMGTQLQNNQVQNMENQLYTQSVFSGAIDTRPQEQYGYSWQGRNSLYSNGGSINDYKTMNNGGFGNIEVEGGGNGKEGEVIQLPNGLAEAVRGDTHKTGGVKMQLPTNTKVFSEKLKIETPKGKKSYSDLAKPFETKKDFEMMKAKHGDDIQKRTAEMIIKFKNNKLEQLFELQEKNKLGGLHSKQVQKETINDLYMEYGGMKKAGNGLLTQKGYDAIDQYENTKGTAQGTSMNMGAGYSKSQEQKIKTFIENSIGLDTWNKMPENLKVQAYSWIFNHGTDSSVWKGLAQAVDFNKYAKGNIDMDEARRNIKESDAIATLKNANFSNDVYNNYVNQVLPAQYQSIADNYSGGFDKGQEIYRNTWKNRPSDIDQFFNEYTNQTSVDTPQKSIRDIYPMFQTKLQKETKPENTFTGVNKGIDFKTLRLSENSQNRRNNFLPFDPTNTPDIYGDPAYRESVFKEFEDRTGIKLNRANSDAVNLEYIRKYQNARTPELTKDYKLNFTRGNQDLYNEFTKQKGYKKSKDSTKESNAFYDWAVANKKLDKDYADSGKWGHEYYNTATLNFETEAEYNKWKQDPDWEQVGNRFVDRSGDPNGMITYYDIHKNWETPSTKKTEGTPVTNEVQKIVDRQPEYNINPNMDIQFPLPNVYGRTPLNYYQTDPNYINPRYLDVQPQLNEVSRGQRAFQNNLGSRGNTEMGNLLQSQANAYNQQNQIFGNKFNYDRNQDSQTQQFNAQAKTQNDMYNQGTWYNQLEDPIRRRESNIGVQQLTDQYRGQERADQALAFKNTKEFMDKDYSYFTNLSPEAQVAYMEVLSKQKQPTKKYGGKVKIKPTLKKKK